MIIGGFQKVSLQDFPGNVACIVFTQGCNFKCGYCHNADLTSFKPCSSDSSQNLCTDESKELDSFFSYINKRKGLLDGVVVTGGEPTLQKDLIDFLKKIKDLGLAIKLDTNGSNPKVLAEIIKLGLVDYIAMDYKYSINDYQKIIGVFFDYKNISSSKDIIINSGIDYEFRITVVPELFTAEIIEKISSELSSSKKNIIQKFNNDIVLNKTFEGYSNTTTEFLNQMKEKMQPLCSNIIIRE